MTQSTQKRLLFLEREAAPVKGLIRRVNELESRVLALEAMLEEIGAALAAHDAVLEFSDEEANDNAAPSAH